MSDLRPPGPGDIDYDNIPGFPSKGHTQNTVINKPTTTDHRPPGLGNIDYDNIPGFPSSRWKEAEKVPQPEPVEWKEPEKQPQPKAVESKKESEKAPQPKAVESKEPPQSKPMNLGKFNFECPACNSVQKHPVSLCESGHIVCANCKKPGGKCSVCNKPYSDDNPDDEMVHCSYITEGCMKLVPRKHLEVHLKGCDYRPLRCFTYGCVNANGNQRCIPYSKFIRHFQTHKGRVFSNHFGSVANGYTPVVDDWPSCRWVHAGFEYGGFTFFVVSQKWNTQLGIWLWILGSEADANLFRAMIIIGGEGSIQYEWEGPVHSIRKPQVKVMCEGACFLTSWEAIKHIVRGKPTDEFRDWIVGFQISDANQERAQSQSPPREQSTKLALRPAPRNISNLSPQRALKLRNTPTPKNQMKPSASSTLLAGKSLPSKKDLETELAKLRENIRSKSAVRVPNFNNAFFCGPDSPFGISFGSCSTTVTDEDMW